MGAHGNTSSQTKPRIALVTALKLLCTGGLIPPRCIVSSLRVRFSRFSLFKRKVHFHFQGFESDWLFSAKLEINAQKKNGNTRVVQEKMFCPLYKTGTCNIYTEVHRFHMVLPLAIIR